MIYNSYVDDVKEEVIETKKLETFVSNTGREERKMIDGENNKLEIKMADYNNNIKNVEWEKENIKTFTTNEYLSSLTFVNGSHVFTETSKTNAFKREPTSLFGLVTDRNETKENSNFTTMIYVVELENEILFCSYESTDGISECYYLEPASLKVIGFSRMFRNLGGCNTTSCYGIDLYGNHLLYNDGKQYIIKESTYDTLVASGVYVVAVDTKLLDTINNGQEQITAKLLVAYYGLYSTENDQVVLWKTENDCERKVAQSAHVAVHSCEAIKKYCNAAKNGKYWLSLSGTSYHVNCDMETDRGGWLMIANIERTGGVALGASDSYVLNELLENPESYFPDYWGMEYVHRILNYTQIRLYCFTDNPERTSHIRTTDTQFGYHALRHILNPSLPAPDVCLSYRFYTNDNSKSLNKCSSWDWGTSTYKYNEFPSRNTVNGENMWSIENGLCDQTSSVYQNAVWKIFLR